MLKSYDDYTKSDWLEENTYGELHPDTDIYRIFRVDYLLGDLNEGKITLVNPCFETQGDDLENPLKNASFDVEGSQHQLFRHLMAEYYTQSWSLEQIPWGTFGGGHDVIRVRTKARKLFDRLVDDTDPFYNLYYHMGLIAYEDSQTIRDQFAKSNFANFLDSCGYNLLKTVLMIRSDFEKEREVRLVYIRSPREGYSSPNIHLVSGELKQFCSHAFNWSGIIDDYEFDPSNRYTHGVLKDAIDAMKQQ